MLQQGSFSQAEYASKKKQTRRDKFLAEMEQVVPWPRLVARLAPLYPKGERGRPPVALERMLRIHFLQQWYALADPAMEEALYDSQAMRGFAGIDLAVDTVPDETTILNFRHWLERHDLAKGLFDEVSAMLEERGSLTGTAANEADIAQTAALLHGEEEDVFGDAGYTGADKRPELADRDVSWNIAIKRSIIKALPKALRELAEPVERALSQVRAVVEHPFHIVKNRFHHKKLRYRGLKKNTAQLHTLFALANLAIVKQALLTQPGR
jgi:IS5 family transposase